MPQKSGTKLLEVKIDAVGVTSWEWRVCLGSDVLICGFESSRVAASFSGYDAMFQMLASGWKE